MNFQILKNLLNNIMGRFANKVSATTKQRSNIIKVNPYELPEKALAVIANICTKQNLDDASVIYDALNPILFREYIHGSNFFDLIDNYRPKLYNIDFLDNLNQLLKKISIELMAHENTNDTQIVVAGGFSAGKSSFLNAITGANNLLPTGIEPISMISTYLYFSDKINEIIVKGINLKNAVVLLDKDVLKCIQHASSSKIYLASVLDKLFVEMPSKDLKGLVFIDTPGYNNSDKANESNGQSDMDTATASFEDGNVLFWIIDIESGTIPAKDKEMINNFLEAHDGEGKVVVIFNKADKKPIEEIKSIINKAAKEYNLSNNSTFIDILAYSCIDNKIHYSQKGYSLPQLLDQVKHSGNGNSGISKYLNQIEELFNDEINFSKMLTDELIKEKNEYISIKDEEYKLYINDKEGCKHYVDSINDIMVNSYNEVLDAVEKYQDSSSYAVDSLYQLWDRLSIYAGNCWSTSNVEKVLLFAKDTYSKCSSKHNAINCKYYNTEYRKDWVKNIKTELDRLNERYKKDYERWDEMSKEKIKEIATQQTIGNGFDFYKKGILDTLKISIKNFQIKAHKAQDARIVCNNNKDIFTAISSGKYNQFMDCFAKGVSLADYSMDGFSPLTHAVREGAIDMVRFFLKHNADINAYDQNGHNAFHVAVMYGYRNICELLIKEDPTIASTLTSKGETAMQLAEKNMFSNWIKSRT